MEIGLGQNDTGTNAFASWSYLGMRLGRDVGRGLHDSNLGFALDASQLMNESG
jgi:hypothetical protein